MAYFSAFASFALFIFNFAMLNFYNTVHLLHLVLIKALVHARYIRFRATRLGWASVDGPLQVV